MKIEHFRTIDKGILKASFQAIFQPKSLWHINMCFFQKDNGQAWYGYPNREYTTKDGERKFFKQAYPEEAARGEYENDLKIALLAQFPVMQDILSSQMPPEQSTFAAPSNNNLPF